MVPLRSLQHRKTGPWIQQFTVVLQTVWCGSEWSILMTVDGGAEPSARMCSQQHHHTHQQEFYSMGFSIVRI